MTEDMNPVDERMPVSTGCAPLDDLLGGGFERGVVSQVYGPPAAGKTNVVLATTVNMAANNGTVVYVDTEGLSFDRFQQLAKGYENEASVEQISDRVFVQEAVDFQEQRTAIKEVDEIAQQADLVVVDSITGFYRLERVGDAMEGDALREIGDQVTHLLSLARKYGMAVVVTNQVFSDPDTDQIRPLGGNTLEHWTGVVLGLERFRGSNRRITLEKHRSKPAGESVTFRITNEGLKGTDSEAT